MILLHCVIRILLYYTHILHPYDISSDIIFMVYVPIKYPHNLTQYLEYHSDESHTTSFLWLKCRIPKMIIFNILCGFI